MGLLIQPPPYAGFRVSNLPAAPSAIMGTTITPSTTVNTFGSWAQVLSALAAPLEGLLVCMNSYLGAATIDRSMIFEIGIDPAGGSSYTTIIPSIVAGNISGSLIGLGGGRGFNFPIHIPAGATVAIRAMAANTSGSTVTAFVQGYGRFSASAAWMVGQYAEAIGAVTASSRGTVFTPSNGSFGSWQSLGTSVRPCFWWQIGTAVADTSITAIYVHVEIAFGNTTNKDKLMDFTIGGNTSEHVADLLYMNMSPHNCFAPLPAGTEFFARGRASGTPDSNYSVALIGIG